MLDVHPPHSPTHTWRDFFIHIATIVIGLLIAIGLEQTVETIHHHRQVAEARQALGEEHSENMQTFVRATNTFRLETVRFQTNLKVFLYIQQHPRAVPAEWPGSINYHHYNFAFNDSAWTTVQHSNVSELMPQSEVRRWDGLYKALSLVMAGYENRLASTRDARTYMVQDFDPSHLSPADLQEEIRLAKTVLSFHYRLGASMRNLAAHYPEFTPAPSTLELDDIMNEPHTLEYTNPFPQLVK